MYAEAVKTRGGHLNKLRLSRYVGAFHLTKSLLSLIFQANQYFVQGYPYAYGRCLMQKKNIVQVMKHGIKG